MTFPVKIYLMDPDQFEAAEDAIFGAVRVDDTEIRLVHGLAPDASLPAYPAIRGDSLPALVIPTRAWASDILWRLEQRTTVVLRGGAVDVAAALRRALPGLEGRPEMLAKERMS